MCCVRKVILSLLSFPLLRIPNIKSQSRGHTEAYVSSYDRLASIPYLHIKSQVYILHDKKIKLQKSKGKLHYFLNTTKILDGNKWKGNTKCLGVCFSFVCKVMVCTTLTLSNNALISIIIFTTMVPTNSR